MPSSSRLDWNISVFSIGILKYLPMPNFSMSHYIVNVKDFRLECFCFLLSCIYKLIYLRSVITQQFNSDGLLRKNYLLVFSLMHQLSSLFFSYIILQSRTVERKHKFIIIMNARPSFTKPDRDSFIQYFQSVLFF